VAHVPLEGGLFDEVLIDRLPLGVVVLDRHGVVVRYNRYEEQLARRRREETEERRVGKECRRLCRSRWSPYH
jgi:PAS domain-containing protein